MRTDLYVNIEYADAQPRSLPPARPALDFPHHRLQHGTALGRDVASTVGDIDRARRTALAL